MSRLKHAVPGGGAMQAHPRDRRKSYYHGKYDKELIALLVICIVCIALL